MVDLFYREYGEAGKQPLVIMHGLLGSSRNWQAAAQALGEAFHVFCLDLRNHGESPWAAPHSYAAMAEDVTGFIEKRLTARPILIGHSMGGKLAMKLACEQPGLLRKLVVVDIVPKKNPTAHDPEFEGMRAVELSSLKSRSDAEAALEPYVKSWSMRKFLVTNLVRDEETNAFRWTINLDAIQDSLRELERTSLSDEQRYDGDSLFVMGGRSRFFSKEDIPLIRRHFPASGIEVIAESGHNPHFECRERFVEIIKEFAE
ncbi:alpha/beta fold hydrolase [Pelagicoccus sp. SDUM812003]|uniref:alpha/beta fold hydrolase n=1 Tax=Pelagicoccus sp. SDUM812003 TaxID=3041267 RepID=UPI00281063EF|nr:alpha/beta fold hydrolase [Pelagicoccus sp. SDUM812003]MDQ8204961.1 alpha/beta fold hydrolase [Pelagicoccus sp. SDUM812003]